MQQRLGPSASGGRAAARPAAAACRALRPAAGPRRARLQTCAAAAAPAEVKPEAAVPGMTAFLDSLKWDKDGLVAVIVQARRRRCPPSRSQLPRARARAPAVGSR
jgi:hypothetical protein